MLIRVAIRDAAAKATTEKERIAKARAELFGVDSVVTLDDFEVRVSRVYLHPELTIKKHAKPLLPFAAWEYYSFGADTEAGMRNNSSAYNRIFFRPRVMRDVSVVDLDTRLLGVQSALPIYATPVARMGLGQDLVSATSSPRWIFPGVRSRAVAYAICQGEIATTHAAARQGVLQVLSHVASKSLDEVMAARAKGQAVGWQLYMNPDR